VKFAIISDIHANVPALTAVLEAIAAEQVDRLVCLGDITGYHTESADCVNLLREAGAICVAGNHDRAVLGQLETDHFSDGARRAVAWTRERLDDRTREFLAGLPLKRSIDGVVVAVHGALHPEVGCEWVRLDDDEKRALSFDALAASSTGARVCAFGHTHLPGVWERCAGEVHFLGNDTSTLRPNALYLVNPGSVGESRDDDPRASFLVLDSAAACIRFRRVAYDRDSVLAKSRQAGLIAPQRFPWIPARQRSRLKQAWRYLSVGSDR
jgi:diadenosine tetraphosphatase ApaH/serine/threonine PP2A family protein phosphatase